MLLTVISLCLDSGVVPIGSAPYAYFVAVQAGLSSALCTCLLINGFIGFQVYEDGTALSVWLLRLCSLVMFLVTGGVAICTFQGWAGLGPTNTTALFIVLYIINALFLFVYVACQVILVVGTLGDRWPMGDITFGVFFFVVGQVMLYVFSRKICDEVYHYLDGLFFASICNLLGVMMVYKVNIHNYKLLLTRSLILGDSTGTPSPKKISSSVSAQKQMSGKSRSYYRKKIEERRFMNTKAPKVIMQLAHTTAMAATA